MEQELAYSFHLGSDKNKSKLAKKVAKENLPGTTSLSNNAIQNAIDSITGATASNRYQIKVKAGVYKVSRSVDYNNPSFPATYLK